MTKPASDSLITLRGLRVHFPVLSGLLRRRQTGTVHAVDGVDLDIRRGETIGLVGESGCGKSTLGRAILQLVRPTAGEVRFDGIELTALNDDELRPLRRILLSIPTHRRRIRKLPRCLAHRTGQDHSAAQIRTDRILEHS